MGSAFSNSNWSLQKCGNLAILTITGAISCYAYAYQSVIPSGYRPYSTEVGECTANQNLYPYGTVCWCLA